MAVWRWGRCTAVRCLGILLRLVVVVTVAVLLLPLLLRRPPSCRVHARPSPACCCRKTLPLHCPPCSTLCGSLAHLAARGQPAGPRGNHHLRRHAAGETRCPLAIWIATVCLGFAAKLWRPPRFSAASQAQHERTLDLPHVHISRPCCRAFWRAGTASRRRRRQPRRQQVGMPARLGRMRAHALVWRCSCASRCCCNCCMAHLPSLLLLAL